MHYLISIKSVVPAYALNVFGVEHWWEPVPGSSDSLQLVPTKDENGNTITLFLRDWSYLQRPIIEGPYKNSFAWASRVSYPEFREFGGDKIYLLNEHLQNEDIENNAIFMLEDIELSEALEPELIQHIKNSIGEANDKPAHLDGGSREHVSDKLSYMNQAAIKFWSNASRSDRSTHPKNNLIEAWLIEKGFTESLASSAATIIRPDWAAKGRPSEL